MEKNLLCKVFEWLNKHLPFKGGYVNYMNKLKMRGFALDAPSFMTAEEKQQLLLTDLMSRLLYMPIVNINGIEGYDRKLISLKRIDPNQEFTAVVKSDDGHDCPQHYLIGEIKPYLRPMSSITKKEVEEWNKLCSYCFEQDCIAYNQSSLNTMSSMTKKEAEEWNKLCNYGFEHDCITYNQSILDNWRIEHYLDFRGLIEKGLALPAKEGMYNFK